MIVLCYELATTYSSYHRNSVEIELMFNSDELQIVLFSALVYDQACKLYLRGVRV